MNTPNNARRRRSRDRLTQALIELLQTKELTTIRVQELCRLAGVNRTTFYACFPDIYALAEAAQEKLEQEVAAFYYQKKEDGDRRPVFLQLFCYIAENQLLFKTYFKLGGRGAFGLTEEDERFALQYYDGRNIDYHVAFFRAGLNAMIGKWLSEGCQKTPEEMYEILYSEYFSKSAS
ncbi:MAG: TetR/AcrR family transcriptional regulator [Oscillospiraceae bacterium]|nr:TetR/AcrR family transcriptional regulator [Oscillospiraceae bacterium]